MVLHADLPEDLAAISAGHSELQRVVMGILLRDKEADIRMDAGQIKKLRERRTNLIAYSGV